MIKTRLERNQLNKGKITLKKNKNTKKNKKEKYNLISQGRLEPPKWSQQVGIPGAQNFSTII